jgi:hypothetical protein
MQPELAGVGGRAAARAWAGEVAAVARRAPVAVNYLTYIPEKESEQNPGAYPGQLA